MSQGEELLKIGVRQTDASFVYSREDGAPLQPNSLSRSIGHGWRRSSISRAFASN